MKNIKQDAVQILAEVCMEMNNDDAIQSFNDIKAIDGLLEIMKAKSLINHMKGRRPQKEKRFDAIFRARLLEAAERRQLCAIKPMKA